MATLNKRDFLEAVTAGPSDEVVSAAKQYADTILEMSENEIAVFWAAKPENRESSPVLAVTDSKRIRDLLAAVNASPKAVSPFTAFCRLMDFQDAQVYLNPAREDGLGTIVDSVAMLSFVEVNLRSGGQLKARQITPAICRRTFCFAWAKALNIGLKNAQLERLPGLWTEASDISNQLNSQDEDTPVVHHALPMLTAAARAIGPEAANSPVDRLIRAIVNADVKGIDSAWAELSQASLLGLSIRDLEQAPREERGSYLQQLLKVPPGDVSSAAQGFLATQVAPGSLEHLELLLTRSGPKAAFWYVLFATLQYPSAILNAFGGTGRRISRDIRDKEDLARMPRADISLDEFRILSRFGSDDLSTKLGHSNEIEIELLPLVGAVFRFGRSQGAKVAPQQVDNSRLFSNLRQVSALVNQALADLTPTSTAPVNKPSRSRKARF